MKVFVSHSPAFTAQAERLTTKLEAAGLRPVGAASPPEPGLDRAAAIDRRLGSADALVFVVGPEAERDAWLQEEWRSAIRQSWTGPVKPMIPVLVGHAELPGFLKDRQAIRVDSEEDWGRVAEQIAFGLKSDLSDETGPTAESGASGSPDRKKRLDEIVQEARKLEPTRGELARQVDLLREEIRRERLNRSDSVRLARLHGELADGLRTLGDDAAALPELNAAAEILRKHPDEALRLARVRANLGTLLSRLQRKEEARAQLVMARDLYIRLQGPESLAALGTRALLVKVLTDLRDLEAARREQEALKTGAKRAVASFVAQVLSSFARRLGGLIHKDDKSKNDSSAGE